MFSTRSVVRSSKSITIIFVIEAMIFTMGGVVTIIRQAPTSSAALTRDSMTHKTTPSQRGARCRKHTSKPSCEAYNFILELALGRLGTE